MFIRIVMVWLVANFLIVGLVSWAAGGWYLGWQVSPVLRGLTELLLIILPNLLLPALVLRGSQRGLWTDVRKALGWTWTGRRTLVSGVLAFVFFYGLLQAAVALFGDSIPYNLPGEGGGAGIQIKSLADALLVLGILLGLLVYVAITVAGEETMFRGWTQTQVGSRYGPWFGLLAGALLFGLRHLPADFFYAQVWQATPQMWVSRQVQLYALAVCLGLARFFGRSTSASAITHALTFMVVLFGVG